MASSQPPFGPARRVALAWSRHHSHHEQMRMFRIEISGRNPMSPADREVVDDPHNNALLGRHKTFFLFA